MASRRPAALCLPLILTLAVVHRTLAAPDCRLEILGRTKGLDAVRLECAGGVATVAINKGPLEPFADSFEGVEWGSCEVPGCFITFCGPSQTVLSKFVVSNVRGGRYAPEGGVICSSSGSKLSIRQPAVKGNNATVLLAMNDSVISIAGGSFTRNIGGSAVAARDQARLSIADTTFRWNRVLLDGAACLVSGNAIAVIDNAVITNNYALTLDAAGSAGAIAAIENGTVILSNSLVANNTSAKDSGCPAGVAAVANATLIVRNSTYLHNDGGAITSWNVPDVPGYPTVDIFNSTFKNNFRYYWSGGGK
jgi:hypothetical protein